MLTVEEALERILSQTGPTPARPVRLSDCPGLVLAQQVVAREAHPPFDNSAMDGYAVRSQDTLSASSEQPQSLAVVEEISAGRPPTRSLEAGQASQIMTGAMVPAGADAVVVVEEVKLEGDRVTLGRPVAKGANIRRAAEHLALGQVVLAPGTRLTPAAVSMAAYLGYPELLCHPRPRVAILATGDELVEPGEPLAQGQIRNSNSYALEAQVAQAGALPLRLPIAPDDPGAIADLIREHLDEVDAVITSAGISMGSRDHVLAVLKSLGGQLDFWRVRMCPGKPFGFGTLAGKPFFGLPGNPVSSMVGFEVFVRPALLKMMGRRRLDPHSIQARMGETVTKRPGLTFFYRCRLEEGRAFLAGPQGSHVLRSLLLADGLLELPEGLERVEVDEPVKVRLLWT